MIRSLTVLACLWAPHVGAQSAFLSPPVACEIGETCFIQQYVDRDPGPGQLDFACGAQANDGHRGTDFRVATWNELKSGVPVLASAAGTVRATRDGMPDIPQNAEDAPDVDGRECGNAVVIDHDDGWQTTYCHLRRGSVTVRSGDSVEVGAQIGEIGASGATEFPHVHLTVRKDGTVIDPFNPVPTNACGLTDETGLWIEPIPTEFGGFLSAGFSTEVPEFEALKTGLASVSDLPENAPALVAWGFLYASRAGDVLRITIDGPGDWAFEREETLDRSQAQLFRAAGRRAPEGGFPQGEYTATITLSRDGAVADVISVKTNVD